MPSVGYRYAIIAALSTGWGAMMAIGIEGQKMPPPRAFRFRKFPASCSVPNWGPATCALPRAPHARPATLPSSTTLGYKSRHAATASALPGERGTGAAPQHSAKTPQLHDPRWAKKARPRRLATMSSARTRPAARASATRTRSATARARRGSPTATGKISASAPSQRLVYARMGGLI